MNLSEFLLNIRIHPDAFDFMNEVENFSSALQDGLDRKADSLPMIPAYIGTEVVDSDKPLKTIVLDAGGTNLRVAVVEYFNGKSNVQGFKSMRIPGSQGEVTLEHFIGVLADLIQPYLLETRKLAFCFSFDAQILPTREAVVNSLAKEVRISGINGVRLGEKINEELARRGDPKGVSIIVLNDAVAALLSGLLFCSREKLEGPVGIIFGTGFNSAYPEPSMVGVYNGVKSKNCMIINTESGSYALQNDSVIDRILDRNSVKPGYHRYEKMISGVYLGELGYLSLKAACGLIDEIKCEKSFFSSSFAERLNSLGTITNTMISEYLAHTGDGYRILSELCENSDDKSNMTEVFETLYKRTALLLAVHVAAVMSQGKIGKSSPAGLIIEGSTYNKSTGLKSYAEEYFKTLIEGKMGIKVVPLKVDDGNIIGSASSWATRPFA